MVYVPGYAHDVFISYSHTDNMISDDDDRAGWVSHFAKQFRIELMQRIGKQNNVNVCFDEQDPGQNISDYMDRVGRSAVLLLIGSPSYIDPNGVAMREYRTFRDSARDLTRIFAIEYLQFDRKALGAEVADDVIFRSFYSVEQGADISYAPKSQEFSRMTKTLASLVQKRLNVLAGRESESQKTREREKSSLKTILLAQAASDVVSEREALSLYLNDAINIVPASSFPPDGGAFETEYLRALEQADIVVQMLGGLNGGDSGSAEKNALFQHDQAVLAGKPVLQWRKSDFRPEDVANPAYRRLVTGADVMATSLEEFKRHVRDTASARPVIITRPAPSFAFVNAAQADYDRAGHFKTAFARADMAVSVAIGDDEEEAQPTGTQRVDLEFNLTECDILVYVFRDAPLTWIRRQIVNYPTLTSGRKAAPRQVVLCVESAEVRRSINAEFPKSVNARDCFVSDWQPERIQSLVQGMLT